MQFHLNYKPTISNNKITHQDKLLLVGSCFSEHIGNKLNDLKFNIISNPFGIVFNPKSIAITITRIIEKNYFTEKEIIQKDEQWICLESHSSISSSSKDELLNHLNVLIDKCHQELKTAHWLIITFGSAFAYKSISQNHIVANCHKLPQALFEKKLLDTHSIVEDYDLLLTKLKQFNSQLNVLFTISPVKHLRDGLIENSLSKAMLIQAVHQLLTKHQQCIYFPAYEIVTDDLRDYRFYESDMAHPNKQAIDYVWKQFSEVYFNDVTNSINEKIKHIHQAYHHRLFNETTGSSIKFKHNFYQKCVTLQAQYPYLNLNNEINYFNTYKD